MTEQGNEQERRSAPAATRRLERKTGRRKVGAAVAGGAVLATYVAPAVLSVGVQEVYAASDKPPKNEDKAKNK